MTKPTELEIEAARQILRSLGGVRRGEVLSIRRKREIAKKANRASQLAKRRKKRANGA